MEKVLLFEENKIDNNKFSNLEFQVLHLNVFLISIIRTYSPFLIHMRWHDYL